MPRKPIGDVAMTSTERVHRFRERQRKANPSDRQKLTEALAEIERLRKELAAKPRQEPVQPAPKPVPAKMSEPPRKNAVEPPATAQRSADDVLPVIHAVLKREKWNRPGSSDRIELGRLFAEVQADIRLATEPKREPLHTTKRKAWNDKADAAMDRYIERCKKQAGFHVANLNRRNVKAMITEASNG